MIMTDYWQGVNLILTAMKPWFYCGWCQWDSKVIIEFSGANSKLISVTVLSYKSHLPLAMVSLCGDWPQVYHSSIVTEYPLVSTRHNLWLINQSIDEPVKYLKKRRKTPSTSLIHKSLCCCQYMWLDFNGEVVFPVLIATSNQFSTEARLTFMVCCIDQGTIYGVFMR